MDVIIGKVSVEFRRSFLPQVVAAPDLLDAAKRDRRRPLWASRR